MIFPRREDATNKELILTIIDIQGFLERYGRSHTNWHETLNEVQARLEQADKALEQEPKTGHWKRISIDKYSQHAMYWYRCDRCGENNLGNTDWCPNCGAKMESEDT